MPIPIGVSGSKFQSARKYFYEKLYFTGWPFAGTAGASSLSTGITSLFNASTWNEPGQIAVRAEIEGAQFTQGANVTYTWTADPGNSREVLNQGDLSAARSGLRRMPSAIRAVDTLTSALNNATGAAVASFQGNLTVSARRLTVMDKVFAQSIGLQSQHGAYSLTGEETAALQTAGMTLQDLLGLVGKGTLPYSTDQWIRLLIDAHTISVHDDFFTVAVSSSDNPFASYTAGMDSGNPARGRFLVFDQFACEGAANVAFTCNRDGQTDSYWQFNGGGFGASDDAPADIFLMAFQHATWHAILGPGASALNAGVRIRVRDVAMSDILAALTGRTTNLPGKTYAKSLIGLMSS